jgi:acetyl-CoA carboxylase biotin carboxyl carrier protein
MNFNLKDIKKLITVLEEADIAEFEYAEGDSRVHLVRSKQGLMPVEAYSTVVNPPIAKASPQAEPSQEAPAEEEPPGHVVTSPFVGTFYRSPSPGSPSFVEVGSIVKKGQTLCIVEAMKLMNEIEAEVDGKVVAIYQDNGDLVEYGEKLFLIQ